MNEVSSLEPEREIEQLLLGNRIVLFMKGQPQFPMCGHSAAATAILKELGVSYRSVNVLERPDISETLSANGYAPTVPQLYIDKKLVAGGEAIAEMYEKGELRRLLTNRDT